MTSTPACWPPVLASDPEVLGYLSDTTQVQKSRDQGRSVSLGGRLYYTFGDTFCQDSSSKWVIISNTCSFIANQSKPLESSYLCIDSTGVAEPLLKLTDKEQQYQNANQGERYTLWPFSGIVEISSGVGLMWYVLLGT